MPFDKAKFESLLARLECKQGTTDDLRQLEKMLEDEPAAREAYLANFAMESMLRDNLGGERLAKRLQPVTVSKDSRSRWHKSTVFAWGLMASLLLAAGIGLWTTRPSNPSAVQGSGVTEPSEIEINEGVVIAKLAHNAGANLLDDSGRTFPLTQEGKLIAGSYQLTAGVLGIEYESGARVIFQAPAEFDLQSESQMDLERGRVSVLCATEESKGFSLVTPSGTAVDLGTEFAVEVSPGGRKGDEYHVFSGEVLVKPKASSALGPVSLREGQATRLDHRTSTPAGIDIDPQRFIRGFDGVAGEYYQRIMSLEPVVYYVMSVEEDGRTLRNETEVDADATIFTMQKDHVKSAPGFNGGTALRMNGTYSETYAVVPDYPKANNDRLSVVAWVFAESRPVWASIAKNWYHGTGPEDRGQFHFGLSELSGALDASINSEDNQSRVVTEAVPIPLNQWHQVAMVADGEFLRLYRNGEEVAATRCSSINVQSDVKALAIGSKVGDESLTPAVRHNGFWDGRIDDLAVFNKALSPKDVRQLFELGTAFGKAESAIGNISLDFQSNSTADELSN